MAAALRSIEHALSGQELVQLGKAGNSRAYPAIVWSCPFLPCPLHIVFFILYFLFFCPLFWCGLVQGLFIVFGRWNQPMGLEVPCTLNCMWSAGCPNRARSNSQGYAGGFQLGKLRAHNPCTIVPNWPHSLERAGSTRYRPADHQQVPGKPLSVKLC